MSEPVGLVETQTQHCGPKEANGVSSAFGWKGDHRSG